MRNEKKQTDPVQPPLEEALQFDFREFLRNEDAFDCINVVTDLILHRDEAYPLSHSDLIDLRELIYFLRKIHDQTYQKIVA